MTTNSRPGIVFISYKSEEAPNAASLRGALVKEGFNVWWDEDLQCGQAWAEKLDEALRNAACIIVLWSNRSVASQWVRHEASQAIAREVYAPCRIELVQLESPYDRIQATDLIGWNGDQEHGGFRNLLARVDELVPASVSLPRRIGYWLHANLATLVASGISAFAIWLLVTIFLAQRVDRREKIYDCSSSRELRAELVQERYSNGEPLKNVCLRMVQLPQVDLSGADLNKADLSAANLHGANFSEGDLSGTDLTTADFSSANLYGVNLSGADLSGADLTMALLRGATLQGAVLLETTLTNAHLLGADLTNANLTEATLFAANLSKATLTKATLTKADLRGSDLTGANLAWASLSKTDLSGANLAKANLTGANLAWASLSKADLSGANLAKANLTKANIQGAAFSKAILLNAGLREANLRDTDLSGADLSGADLSGADLSGAELTETIFAKASLINKTDIIQACADDQPIEWPKDRALLPQCLKDKKKISRKGRYPGLLDFR